jgi:hypothetical protein
MIGSNAGRSDALLEFGNVAENIGRLERLRIVGEIFLRHDHYCVAADPFKNFLCLESLVGVQTDLVLEKCSQHYLRMIGFMFDPRPRVHSSLIFKRHTKSQNEVLEDCSEIPNSLHNLHEKPHFIS